MLYHIAYNTVGPAADYCDASGMNCVYYNDGSDVAAVRQAGRQAVGGAYKYAAFSKWYKYAAFSKWCR